MARPRLPLALREVERHAASVLLSAAGVTLLAAGMFAYTMPFGVTATAAPSPAPSGPASSAPSSAVALPPSSAGTSPSPVPSGKPPVATRVVVPALRIDLPIVSQATEQVVRIPTPTGPKDTLFPYCNVAEYVTALSQPGRPGTTYLFAHARVGMFLPLLTASMLNNGASMLGYTVLVYTSDSKVYWYSIAKVKRGVSPTGSAVWTITKTPPGVQQLVLQTSEGPWDSSTKLQVLATFELVQPADPAQAHPTPHPVVCA